ncbi:HAD family hydrolase [Arsenicicoccus dermatophilus]|uniref:HAD family hydrolase n=1 Tax=Arsenicicoccus dermatophilus TaxID=1076331 RepID=UPI001F4D0C22|nr:HAD family phosphatase [Arsenicicoccus dermatophilus]MCH8612634.1 HAD family phosphatase [Arsenicicoccus dermatophilus]
MSADRCLLLDVDGTLIDSTYHHGLAWLRAFAEVGIHPPLWRVHRAIGMGGDQLVTSVAGAAAEERLGDHLRERWQHHYQLMLPEIRPLPGAVELVRMLLGRGDAVAIASSGEESLTEAALSILGFCADDFAAVTSAGDADASKPEPDIFRIAHERAGGGRGLVIGDTTYDVTAAARADLPCVVTRTGGFGVDELRASGAALVVEELPELLHLPDARWDALLAAPVPDAPDVRPGQ